MQRLVISIAALFLLLTAATRVATAQRMAASISGTVTDPSGAAIPGARITATALSTGAQTGAESNGEGVYVLSNLQPGMYRLRVEAAGFESYEQTSIILQVGQPRTVNARMKVGAATQQVVVTGQPPLVDTTSQTVSYAITPQFTEMMPLNGRNVLQLLSLAPDASAHNPYANNYSNQLATRPETADSGFVTASGEARENSTTYYLDGGLNEDTYTDVANVFPNPDAVEEFTIDTNSYNAKFGGAGGCGGQRSHARRDQLDPRDGVRIPEKRGCECKQLLFYGPGHAETESIWVQCGRPIPER